MIRRVRGELVAECCECGAEFCGGTEEWDDFIASLKGEGWRIRRDDDEEGLNTWEHFCPDCVAANQW